MHFVRCSTSRLLRATLRLSATATSGASAAEANATPYTILRASSKRQRFVPLIFFSLLNTFSVAGGDLCLVGCVFYPADTIDNDWVTTITLNGGVVDYTYGARTTHVIVESMRHQCVHQASPSTRIIYAHEFCHAHDECAASRTFSFSILAL